MSAISVGTQPLRTDGDYETVRFSVDSGLARLTLNRPEKLNSLNFALISEVVDALSFCARSDSVRAVLLDAAGEKAFCAGYDLKGMGEPFDPPTQSATLRAAQRVERIEDAITQLNKPVIVAVRGWAIGSGLDIVLSCDYIICSVTAKLQESRIFRANMATVHWLPLYVGWAKAREMIYRGTVVDGETAARIGLANHAVADGDLDAFALETAASFAAGPTVALGMYKEALRDQVLERVRQGQQKRNSMGLLLKDTADIVEAKQAFKEKREPRFTGK